MLWQGWRHSMRVPRVLMTLLHPLQVGSKNAAFFMGRCIKVATRRPGDAFVHELTIGAEELEQRYREHKVGCRLRRVPASEQRWFED